MEVSSEVESAIEHTRMIMALESQVAFINALLFNLRFQWTDKIATAGVTARSFYLNPEFFMKCSKEERVGLFIHELLHVALDHVSRTNSRVPFIHNIACDFVINGWIDDLIKKSKSAQSKAKFALPAGGLLDHKYDNMTSEEVYELLIQNAEKVQGDSIGGDLPLTNPVLDELDKDLDESMGIPTPTEEEEQKIRDELVIRAKVQAEVQMGASTDNLPVEIQRFFEAYMNPVLSWKKLLAAFMNDSSRNGFSMSRPNKRHTGRGMYLPSQSSSNKLSVISFAIDTSGSISNQDFQLFMSEVHHVLKGLKPSKLELLQFDQILQSVDIVKNTRELSNVEMYGGGGTCITTTIKHFLNNKESKALVVITDGYIYDLNRLPMVNKPVLWVVYDNPDFKEPFGKSIHFDKDDLEKSK